MFKNMRFVEVAILSCEIWFILIVDVDLGRDTSPDVVPLGPGYHSLIFCLVEMKILAVLQNQISPIFANQCSVLITSWERVKTFRCSD